MPANLGNIRHVRSHLSAQSHSSASETNASEEQSSLHPLSTHPDMPDKPGNICVYKPGHVRSHLNTSDQGHVKASEGMRDNPGHIRLQMPSHVHSHFEASDQTHTQPSDTKASEKQSSMHPVGPVQSVDFGKHTNAAKLPQDTLPPGNSRPYHSADYQQSMHAVSSQSRSNQVQSHRPTNMPGVRFFCHQLNPLYVRVTPRCSAPRGSPQPCLCHASSTFRVWRPLPYP